MIDRPALRYHGGKFRLAPWIVSHFPAHGCYVEPFGGAASVLLFKRPAAHEVYNDLDGHVVGFFRVLREQPKSLIEAIHMTPYSRAEFRAAWADKGEPGTLEAARRLYIRSYQTFGNGTGERTPSWRFSKSEDSPSPPENFYKCESLYAVAERFRSVHIECDEAITVMHRFDTPNTLVYADPPYVMKTRDNRSADYTHDFTDQDHIALSEALHSLSGPVILSGYDCELYRTLYSDWKMAARAGFSDNGAARTECLWLSPGINAVQLSMFGIGQ